MKEDSRKYLLIVIFKALVVLWTGAATVLPSATTSQSTAQWSIFKKAEKPQIIKNMYPFIQC